MPWQRLDKWLAATGRWSRREAKTLIAQGRVTVNGVPAGKGEDRWDETAEIRVDGERLPLRAHIYIMLNKPAGLLSATKDPRQKTVLDLLPPEYRRKLFPVGRLDKDTVGLLLLTDDGALAHQLLSPRRHVDKTYYVRLDAPLGREDQEAFAKGLLLKDGTVCLPARLELLEDGQAAYITLWEGKYHQIKRMTASRGAAVTYLKRVRMGTLTLDPSLAEGAFRFLTPEEIRQIGGSL